MNPSNAAAQQPPVVPTPETIAAADAQVDAAMQRCLPAKEYRAWRRCIVDSSAAGSGNGSQGMKLTAEVLKTQRALVAASVVLKP